MQIAFSDLVGSSITFEHGFDDAELVNVAPALDLAAVTDDTSSQAGAEADQASQRFTSFHPSDPHFLVHITYKTVN